MPEEQGRVVIQLPSQQTIRNRLRENNIRARGPARGPPLSREHRVARLQFARAHADWGTADWSNFSFTDESRYYLYASDKRIPVYRPPGELYVQYNFRQMESYGSACTMVCVCVRACVRVFVFMFAFVRML